MSKNVVIALILGLVIGGVAIWLLLSFGVLGSTMVGGGATATKISPSQKYVTDEGTKSYQELVTRAGSQNQGSGGGAMIVPADGGKCGWIVVNGQLRCGTYPGKCSLEDGGCQEITNPAGELTCMCTSPQ